MSFQFIEDWKSLCVKWFFSRKSNDKKMIKFNCRGGSSHDGKISCESVEVQAIGLPNREALSDDFLLKIFRISWNDFFEFRPLDTFLNEHRLLSPRKPKQYYQWQNSFWSKRMWFHVNLPLLFFSSQTNQVVKITTNLTYRSAACMFKEKKPLQITAWRRKKKRHWKVVKKSNIVENVELYMRLYWTSHKKFSLGIANMAAWL